ncbi:hypothetical protein [Rhodococcoides yunnanense]|uniref:hypothetical protein n=1 Tax=Rhodococcoides yunnanense TaxID=278209 RepID=UPI0022B12DC5|nr:hypothetical protein [Rhodococcus yunnanensis]MCZ4278847.1 hypothetical protein [Rhodococcus yunnanensis]
MLKPLDGDVMEIDAVSAAAITANTALPELDHAVVSILNPTTRINSVRHLDDDAGAVETHSSRWD